MVVKGSPEIAEMLGALEGMDARASNCAQQIAEMRKRAHILVETGHATIKEWREFVQKSSEKQNLFAKRD